MSKTKYQAVIDGLPLEKVRSLTVEKNLSQYSGKFDLSVSDPENHYYNQITSGDEIQVIEQYKKSSLETNPYDINTNLLSWNKLNGNIFDSQDLNDSFYNGLIAAYSFNGNANDIINNNHGVVVGATLISNRFGEANKAYNFNGSNQYISLENVSDDLKPKKISVAAWVKVNTNDKTQMIYRWRMYGVGLGIGLDNDGNPLWKFDGLVSDIDSEENKFDTTCPFNELGEWVFVVGTFDGKTSKLYVNGELKSFRNINNIRSNIYYKSGGWASIGRDGDHSGSYFDGVIDDLLIYERDLSDKEIKDLFMFSSGSDIGTFFAGAKKGSIVVRATAYYPFNGNANDESTSGKHGTVNGAILTTDRFGRKNKAYKFDGTISTNITVSSANINISSKFSVSFWCNPSPTATGGILNFQDASSNNLRFFISSNGVLEVDQTPGQIGNRQAQLQKDVWQHVVTTYDGTNLEIYVNGVLTGRSKTATFTFGNISTILMGRLSSAHYYKGILDEVFIIPEVMTANEVANLYDLSGGRNSFLQNDCSFYVDYNITFDDISGNNNYPSNTKNKYVTVKGRNGKKALFFDGDDAYIEYNNNHVIPANSPFSVGGWINLKGTNKTNMLQGIIGDSATTIFFLYVNKTNNLGIHGRNSANTAYNFLESEQVIPFDEWSFVIATYDEIDDKYRLYINGELVSTSPSGVGGRMEASSKIRVGSWDTTSVRYLRDFNGLIEQLFIMQRKLSDTEIQKLYNDSKDSDFCFTGHKLNDVYVDGEYGKGVEAILVGQYQDKPNYGVYIDLGATTSILPQSGSISWWYKTDETKNAARTCNNLFANGVGGWGSSRIDININNNTIQWESTTNNKWQPTFQIGKNIKDNKWHHYVLTASTENTKLYVDGELTSTQTANTDIGVNQNSRYIGSYNTTKYNYGSGLGGSIDDIRFYNIPLTLEQIKEIYENQEKTKVFGGYVENIQRDKDNKYVLNIDGGDYTTTLNNTIILAEVYNGREYSVIIRDIMHKYIMNSILIDDMELTDGWNKTNGTLTLEKGQDTEDNLIPRLGEACLKITPTNNTGTLYKTVDTILDYDPTDYITLYFYIKDIKDFNSLTLDIGQANNKYFTIKNSNQKIKTGWNYLEFDLKNRIIGAGTPTLTGIQYFRLNFNLQNTNSHMFFDDLRRVKNSGQDITLSKVQMTPYYTDIRLKNITVFDAIRKIKDIRVNIYDFYVDIDRILNFGSFGEIDSEETLQRGVNVLKSEFWDDDNKLCNKVTVYGGKQNFDWVEILSGDGTKKEFTLQYTPITQEVYVLNDIKRGYVQGMSATDYDYRVNAETKTIIFNTAPPNAENNVTINYTYGVPIIVQKQDNISIEDYGIREQKLENDYLLTKADAQTVAINYIEMWKNPILNAKYSIRVNPMIDIGERVGVIDERYFKDSNKRMFGVVSLKHTFIGGKMSTELGLTEITKTVEMYLQELFSRINALEEKDKNFLDALTRPLYFSESLGLVDNPSNNFSIKFKSTSYNFVLGLARIGVNMLGDVPVDWSDNIVVNPSS